MSRRSRAKVLLYVALGAGLVTSAAIVAVLVAVVRAFDTDRDLTDFADQAQARAFVSSHLPTPLPPDAVIEGLDYERWTDWSLKARVRLPSRQAVERYVEEAKRLRKLDDDYCHHVEPDHGARYFLAEVSACGTLESTSSEVLEVRCNTR
jgi:hypothetical protein